MTIEKAIAEMEAVFKTVPYGIEHTMRVLRNAERIAERENVGGRDLEVIALASVLHDIGAVEAQKRHGSMDGRYQEIEGPAVASAILDRIGVPIDVAARVCFIVGNHHTPSRIDGIDFQIVWEADQLENLLAKPTTDRTIDKAQIGDTFATETGRELAEELLNAD